MGPVKVLSHYGQPILLDQCPRCGGIWFDESELFRAKQGEADKTDPVDGNSLRSPAEIGGELHCPRDGARLFRFSDRQFPESIALLRCPSCRGIWLNRGGFSAYQQNRGELAKARGGLSDDPAFRQSVREVIIAAPAEGGDNVMGRLGRFLNADLNAPVPGPAAAAPDAWAQETAGAALTVLMTLLRLFLLK